MNVLEDRIKWILEENRQTFVWLAKQIGYSRQGLMSGIKNKKIKLEALEDIAKALGVSIVVLVEDDINDGFRFIIPDYLFVDDKIEFLSKLHVKFSDKLSFYKDYYLFCVIKAINNGFKPEYKCNTKEFSGKVLTDKNIKIFEGFIGPLAMDFVPFSQLSAKNREKIYNTMVFDGFYFPIFDINFLNICNLLEDKYLNEEREPEIVQYWNAWKSK